MTAAIRLAVRQGSPQWLEARRSLITSTDVPVLLGISPWKCEADLADEKLGIAEYQEPTLRMRIGSTLQDLIGQEYATVTGRSVKPVRDLWLHPEIEWAAASPDFRVVGEKRLVEAKSTNSRTRFADGLPDDVMAQMQWAMGVSGYPVSDAAVLLGHDALMQPIPEVEFDAALFENLVAIAEDFRRRLAEGGPFARDAARIRRDHPIDDGSEIDADDETTEAVLELLRIRASAAELESIEERIKSAIQARMGDAARLRGPGFSVSWKRTKEVTVTDWRLLADGLMRQLPETQRDALVSLHSTVRPGNRQFRVVLAKEG